MGNRYKGGALALISLLMSYDWGTDLQEEYTRIWICGLKKLQNAIIRVDGQHNIWVGSDSADGQWGPDHEISEGNIIVMGTGQRQRMLQPSKEHGHISPVC